MADWKCAGCGIISPRKIRICDCPTGCVFKYMNGKMTNELKIEHYDTVADHCHAIIGRMYERGWRQEMPTEDIDLIKTALASYAKI